jgi:two-component system, NtrC family, response regulator AtoC
MRDTIIGPALRRWHAVCKPNARMRGTLKTPVSTWDSGDLEGRHFVTTTDRFAALLERLETGFIAGVSPAMQSLESVIAEIAPTNIPVLLVGESGTGKEMFANLVHRLSRNSEKPLARISCAAMNAPSFAAELGLSGNGKTELPRREFGTVFFDEISELDAICQRNLLCALPDGEGASSRGLLTSRVISTTSRNLDEEMHAGRFRSELYYRINGVCLRLPPLRERKEDIPLLAEFFLTKHASRLERPRPSVSRRTSERFMEYSWPGNIRELENVAKKLVALGDEELALAELAVWKTAARKVEAAPTPGHSLKAAARAASREAERELILEALNRTRWNRKRAAQELQISYKSLLHKLKQIGFADSKVNS